MEKTNKQQQIIIQIVKCEGEGYLRRRSRRERRGGEKGYVEPACHAGLEFPRLKAANANNALETVMMDRIPQQNASP